MAVDQTDMIRAQLDADELPLVPARGTLARGRPWRAVVTILGADVAALAIGVALVWPPSRQGWLLACATLASLVIGREYRARLTYSILNETPRLVQRLAVPIAVVLAGAAFAGLAQSTVRQAVFTAAAVFAGRVVSFAVIRLVRRHGYLVQPTVIIGAGEIGSELHRLLKEHPEYGLLPVGIVDDVAPERATPLLGPISEIRRVLVEFEVRHVIVAFSPTRAEELVRVLRTAVLHDVEVHIVPRFFEVGLAPSGPDVDVVWGIPLYRVRRAALRANAWRIKRVLDVAVAGASLVLLAPVFGAIALGVRLTSPGPVLFRQRRIGQHGSEIEVLKFRTMQVNDDADVTWSVSEDHRLTSVGRTLRRLSLDELPQLWNVLRGDMSLVGPRPERPYYVDRFAAAVRGYGDRHRVPVGLTGLAQVHGLRGDTSIEERARFDNYYIEHWSPWRDIAILLRTFAAVLRDARLAADRKRNETARMPKQAQQPVRPRLAILRSVERDRDAG